MGERYFIGHDGSGHEYLVPVEKTAEWFAWAELDDDDEAAWEVPPYAHRIDGGTLTFSAPQIGGEPVRAEP
jgi:hypothetical protein